ncbi:UNVERIFIED_CONTAM: hypothetical protein FKN15_029892 [Acipenser sinensis]
MMAYLASCWDISPLLRGYAIGCKAQGLSAETKLLLSAASRKKPKGGSKGEPAKEEEPKTDSQPISIQMSFKRYVFDPHKKMVQS